MVKIKANKKAFALRLRLRAEELGLSRAEIASKLHVKPTTVQHWFNARNLPRKEVMPGLAALLNVTVRWLKWDTKDNKFPYEAHGAAPGATIPPKEIGEHDTGDYRCPFEDKELAWRIKDDLAYIEKIDPVEYRWLVQRIMGKAEYYRQKKTANSA